MLISNLKVNHLSSPLGFDVAKAAFSFQVEKSTGKFLKAARIRVSAFEDMRDLLYDSGMREDISSLGFTPDYRFEGGKRYYFDVTALADDGDTGTSAPAFFEGGREKETWDVPFIASPFEKTVHPVLFKHFQIAASPIRSARLYITGFGLYEAYINGKKSGDEVLTPYFNDYRFFTQYSTYDVTEQVSSGENTIAIMLGNGWYKGRFGFIDDGIEGEIYGDQFKASAELVITLEDGSRAVVATGSDWKAITSPVLFSNIYDGEVYDASLAFENRLDDKAAIPVIKADPPQGPVIARKSPPLRLHERLKPAALIITPKGEQLLDFGQEITGWVEFDCAAKKGEKVYLQHSEIMQEGCFYRDNLRNAKAEYTYISDGNACHVRPYFTYYGFRYVKVEGVKLTDENLGDYAFEACAIYSDLERTGFIETSDKKVNRLMENTLWGQKGNFLDVPTDCPQRNERLGWTGDAQVFCATATYHMDTAVFFNKYLLDMRYEQRIDGGAVPYVVPDVVSVVKTRQGIPAPSFLSTEWGQAASCAWGDAATVIPWTMYTFYGDAVSLNENYENMKLWTDFIINIDNTHSGGIRLWNRGFHFADWLALDNPDKESRFGRTDSYYVASVYYLYSAELTAKAAKVLGKAEDAAYYEKIAEEVRAAIQNKYVTPDGTLTIDTQTALVLAIHFDIMPEQFIAKTAAALKQKLIESNGHLTTGFVGTAYLCRALTKVGLSKEAYTLLLNEDYPSWLYEVNMGATTIWERWNSVLPDGSISDTGMNSLNHYAYGAVAEWVYRSVCGIALDESAPGFKKAILSPVPDKRLGFAKAEYRSAAGTYRCGWELADGKVIFDVSVPFDCEARFILPEGFHTVSLNGKSTEAEFILTNGRYQIEALQA